MTSLKNYLSTLIELATDAEEGSGGGGIRLRLNRGAGAKPRDVLKDQGTRWKQILTTAGTECPVTEQVSLMLCKGLERWFGGFIQEQGSKVVYREGGCNAGTIAATNASRDLIRCPYNSNKENWQFYDLKTPLSLGKAETRTFIVCRDIIAIFLTGLVNIHKNEEAWIENTSGKDPCQCLYDWYRQWGGKEAAERVMELLFPTGGRLTLGGSSLQMTEKQADKWWAILLRGVPLMVEGLQCSKDPEHEGKYTTSCVRYRQDRECHAHPPGTWNPNIATQGLVLETGETTDKIQENLDKVIKEQVDDQERDQPQQWGVLDIVKVVVGAGISGGFIPLAWYMWRRIFRRPTRVRSQETKTLAYGNRLFS
ncbi:hypothetical protein C922_05090 [Plasmodium inui San Antonio 1]|uniref:Uncharacterized protein n=1 Tax=Plasmodium inui San Antonio 1 TaxID=1237626 RepID=W6ZYZ3_9APIC|nr:hypothetical protein C922_05090 [Plasmodium inui San Antonio 1]EUD64528.1 hypothetical protein C922_05090 [Plasmodium inui San Antonio 1]